MSNLAPRRHLEIKPGFWDILHSLIRESARSPRAGRQRNSGTYHSLSPPFKSCTPLLQAQTRGSRMGFEELTTAALPDSKCKKYHAQRLELRDAEAIKLDYSTTPNLLIQGLIISSLKKSWPENAFLNPFDTRKKQSDLLQRSLLFTLAILRLNLGGFWGNFIVARKLLESDACCFLDAKSGENAQEHEERKDLHNVRQPWRSETARGTLLCASDTKWSNGCLGNDSSNLS